MSYIISIITIISIYLILVLAYNIALGYAGLMSLAHVAIFAIGAYASALLSLNGVPVPLSIFFAIIICAICGIFLMVIVKKIKGDYLALATLAFHFLVFTLLLNATKITNGSLGLRGIPPIFDITNQTIICIIYVAIAAIVYAIFAIILNSRFGTLLQALRDDELRLQVLGRNTFILKLKAMGISAGLSGLAGALLAHYIQFIDPYTFGMTEIIFVITMVLLGGASSWKGSIAGTIFVFVLLEALRFIPLPAQMLGPLRQIMYALILLIILRYRSRGLIGGVDL